MPRIPESELARIKQEVSIQRLAEAAGLDLQRHGGSDFIARCPWHDDETPSLVISPDKNLWHCLGACQQGGSVIDWVMKERGVSFRHAVELLRADMPVAPAEGSAAKGKMLPPVVEPDAGQHEAMKKVVAYYHQRLLQTPDAMAYLQRRGLGSSELIERFSLGFCDRTLGYHIPPRNRKAGAEIRGQLQRAGVLRESGHEHFRGSIVVPIFDERGRVLEMYGRKINDNLRPGTPKHLYLPGPHRGVWNLEAFGGTDEIIVCESLFDAMTFWCAGYRHVTAAYGTAGFGAAHLQALLEHDIERVLVAYDADAAGRKAAAKLAARLGEHGISVFAVRFPRGMDANEYARTTRPASRALGLALRHATWMDDSAPPKSPRPSGEVRGERDEEAAGEAGESAVSEDVDAKEPDEGEGSDGEAAETQAPPASVEAEPTSSLAASPMPPPQGLSIPAEVKEHEVWVRQGDRRYRIRGLAKNLSFDVMKVNVLARRGEAFHIDTFDLYAAKARGHFVRQAAELLEVPAEAIARDLGRVLLKLEELQDHQMQEALEPERPEVELSDAERKEAMALLEDPGLLERILEDFERCGVVGEQTNKLVGYLSTVSRKLEQPLAVIIQSSSAAGKSSLMEAILAFVPDEDRVKYSAMTGQSLFYMGETNLKHKILAIVEEEGAERASYAIKLLQSEGELTIASTGKDGTTGRMITHEYRVEGPVMILLTTTAIDIDEELLNRCLVLTVSEDAGQTAAIHDRQRRGRTLAGRLEGRQRQRVRAAHANAQRLLRPLMVVNPYAEHLSFPAHKTRMRRDHVKYLGLIDTLALLHQHQRPIKTVRHGGQSIEYIEVTLDDIAVAGRLCREVLGRCLDELPPQTRRLLALLEQMVAERCQSDGLEPGEVRFTRRQVREYTGLGQTQVQHHLRRLQELEYVLVHHGGRGQQFVYELLWDGGADERQWMPGLIDPQAIDPTYDGHLSGVLARLSERNRGQIGGVSDTVGARKRSAEQAEGEDLSEEGAKRARPPQKTYRLRRTVPPAPEPNEVPSAARETGA